MLYFMTAQEGFFNLHESALNNVNMGIGRFFSYKYCAYCIFLKEVKVLLHKADDRKLQKTTRYL